MDLMKIGAQLFIDKMGSNGGGLDASTVMASLGKLLPTNGNELDLSSLISGMQSGGLSSLVGSFLGDGENEPFSPTQLIGALGKSKVDEFASSLGLKEDEAAQGLSQMIPELIDNQSEGGSMLSGLAASTGKSVLGKLF